ncbi:MAG: MBOAT family protein [Synergistaceae bacterium]|nr:MBOAT family protein [Synergistaceae bacterium]
MVFSSNIFMFLFLPLLLIIYYSTRSLTLRNYVLLTASLLFYAWGEPVFVFIMLASIFANWFISLVMSKSSRKKLWLVLAISLDVVLLGVFKYAGFITENLGLTRVNIALPIGISFFTFQMMSYVFDVYYGKAEAQRNPLYVALYISFFPQLIAGPIVRYSQINSEITERHENFDDFSEGVKYFIYGLGKKVLIANFVAQVADNVFNALINPSVLTSWLGALSYTLQIYYDFSGYSDMAIGLGLMFGFHFEKNFNYPYIASSVTDFWRRWHISLSTWFRDYVYIPLGGNRVSR